MRATGDLVGLFVSTSDMDTFATTGLDKASRIVLGQYFSTEQTFLVCTMG